MIKLKRNSLVYRYINLGTSRFSPREPKSICSLFWAVVFATIAYICKTFIVTILILWAAWFVLYPILQFFVPMDQETMEFTATGSMLLWIFIGIGAFAYARQEMPNTLVIFRVGDNESTSEGEEKRPNWFFEWIKAKKRKVCPLIEWETNE